LREGQGGTYTYAVVASAPAGDDGEGGAPAATKEVYVGEWVKNFKHGIGK